MSRLQDAPGDKISPDHENITPLFMRRMAAYDFFRNYVQGRKVLEVGFGDGYGTFYLSQVAADTTGIDASSSLIDYARSKYVRDNLFFLKGDAARIPFPAGSFEAVVSAGMLENVRDCKAVLREMDRVLVGYGTALVVTQNRRSELDPVNPHHYREFGARELERTLKKVFSEVQVYGLFGSGRYTSMMSGHSCLARKFFAADFMGIRRLLPRPVIRAMAGGRKEGHGPLGSMPEEAVLTLDDFRIDASGADKALDLIAVCKK